MSAANSSSSGSRKAKATAHKANKPDHKVVEVLKGGAKAAKSLSYVVCPRTILQKLMDKRQRFATLCKGRQLPAATDAKASWYDISKADAQSDKLLATLQNELEAETVSARNALASAYGDKPVTFVLPVLLTLSNASANVLNTQQNIDMSQAGEWSSLAALFDEYRWRSGVARFSINGTPNNPIVGGSEGLLCVYYNPDSSAVTSIATAAQRKEHKLFAATFTFLGASAVSSAWQTSLAEPQTFKFKPPPGDNLVLNSTSVTAAPGTWKTVGSATGSYEGVIGAYAVDNVASTTYPIVGGIMYYTVEMRFRA